MIKHTPGPWTIQKPRRGIDKMILVREPRIFVDYDDVDLDEAEANARLIAAAPDLLEALESLTKAVGSLPAVKDGFGGIVAELCEARTAIAKATGAAE